MIWTHPEFIPGSHPVQLREGVVPVLLLPQVAGDGVEVHAEAVADPVGEDLLEVRAHLSAHRRPVREERVVRGRRPVVVEAQDHAGQVRVVRLRAAELVVGLPRPERAVLEVLHLAAPAVVAHLDVELAVLAEPDDPAVVVAARRGIGGVVLEDTQLDQVEIEGEGGSVPEEAVDAVAEQRDREHVRPCPRRAAACPRTRPATAPWGRGEAAPSRSRTGRPRCVVSKSGGRAIPSRPRSELLFTARSSTVDWTHAAHDALDLAGVLLQDQHVAAADEGQVHRGHEAGGDGAHGEGGVDDARRRRSGLRPASPAARWPGR